MTPPSPAALRRFVRDAAIAASVAALLLLPSWTTLLDPAWRAAGLAGAVQFRVALVLGALFAGATFAAMRLRRRIANPAWKRAADITAAFACLALLGYVLRPYLPSNVAAAIGATPATILVIFAAALLAAVAVWAAGPILQAARIVLLVLSPFAALAFAQSLLFGAGVLEIPAARDDWPAIPRLDRGNQAPRRVVIVLFDELDYRAVFGAGAQTAPLPAFERLRAESVFAAQGFAAGPHTQIAVPAMLTGRAVRSGTWLADDIALTLEDGTQTRYGDAGTLFAALAAMGRTSVRLGGAPAGRGEATWVAGPHLRECRTFAGCLRSQLYYMLARLPLAAIVPLANRIAAPLLAENGELVAESVSRGAELAAAADADLVFVHLMLPHEPYVFDPQLRAFTPRAGLGYFDNVAGADHALGRIRAAMEASGVWQHTALIVLSDHWWRANVAWSGVRDHRVPFFVRLPGADPGRVLETPFNAVALKDLVLGLVGGSLSSADDVAAFLAAHPVRGELPATLRLHGDGRAPD